jgi:hypothetical protein
MTARSTTQEDTMTPAKLTIGLTTTVAAVVLSLGAAAGAGARVPVEPGPGSPVTHQHQPRVTSVKKAIRRFQGGYPATAGQHVKSLAEERAE